MLLGSYLEGYPFWLLLGFALLISELFVPGLVAAFFGIGALIVGVLTLLGVIEGLAAQLTYFALISLAALFSLRRHFKRWLRGEVSDKSGKRPEASDFVGSRVLVLSDFEHGIGTIQMNGAKWDAESVEPLKSGDTAWVIGQRSIVLLVSAQAPAAAD